MEDLAPAFPVKVLAVSLCLIFTSCAAKPEWQSDAVVLFGDEGTFSWGKYIRTDGSRVIEGSLMEDLRRCGVTRFKVFNYSGRLTDTDGFHVIAPRREVHASLRCLRGKLPTDTQIRPYLRSEWPEGWS